MKKSKSKVGKGSVTNKKRVTISAEEPKEKKEDYVDYDDDEGGFGGWLKTGDGIEWMRLFVIGNSLIVFLTMTWPQLQKTIEIFKEFIYGEE